MEAAVSEVRHEPAPVLSYAMEQRRWDRVILWLAALVCVTQLLMVPAGASELLIILMYHIPFENVSPAVYGHILGAFVSFATMICCGMLLLNLRPARIALIFCTWIMVVLLSVGPLHFVGASGGSMFLMDDPVPVHLGQKMVEFVMGCYPVVLLSAVQKRRGEGGRQWSAAVIWWMTAAAALVVAAPTVLEWLAHFQRSWNANVTHVFSFMIDTSARAWWKSIMGLGTVVGAFACFSAYAAVAWTLFRGTSGRWALMICAALWVVSAVLCYVPMLLVLVQEALSYRLLAAIQRPAAELRCLAAFLAFPLAMRVALTLSDVRAKLEGKAGR